jgi:predicted TIM-barrel fold metal-dependent hydrolase
MILNDVHCHFFSSRFLELLTASVQGLPDEGRAAAVSARLGWDDPRSADDLADRWAAELDRHGVERAVLIASIHGDEESVAAAVRRHPARFVGFFMFNPLVADASERLTRALGEMGLRGVCLFPAMHRYPLDHDRVAHVFEMAARNQAVVFAHCGVLSVGVRKKLGLLAHPSVPVIVPHFGAGFFREALIAADQCPNVHLDTSSSNSWIKYHPGLTLEAVFRQALAVAGPDRLLFGTDSSFFPRGWQKPVHDAQMAALASVGAGDDVLAKIAGGNFNRLFPPQ